MAVSVTSSQRPLASLSKPTPKDTFKPLPPPTPAPARTKGAAPLDSFKPLQTGTPSTPAKGAAPFDFSRLQGLLGGAGAKPAPAGNNGVAVFDTFTGPDPMAPHGKGVSHVVEENRQRGSSSPVREIPVNASAPYTNLDDHIDNLAAGLLDDTSDAIQGILDNPGDTKVINQSMGVSPAFVFNDIVNRVAMEDEALRAQGLPAGTGEVATQLKEDLGLPEGTEVTDKEGLRALLRHTEEAFENSPRIAQARQRYEEQSQKLEEAGILHVVAAGNDGLVAAAVKQNVPVGDDFAKSVLSNDKAITVGATTGEDVIAGFSSPSDEVDVAVDGENIDLGGGKVDSGTSFAAPQVAAVISDLFAINPHLTNDQVRGILAQAARDTTIPDEFEGQGILDPERARQLARQSLGPLGLSVPEL